MRLMWNGKKSGDTICGPYGSGSALVGADSTPKAMNLLGHIQKLFDDSIATKRLAREQIAAQILRAGNLLAGQINAGAKVLSCGNGGSAADAQHFSSEMINRFERDRRALPAVALSTDTSALTSIANDSHYDRIFARQIEALGCDGDVLLAISTSGNSANVNAAVRQAQQQHMHVVALNGKDGGETAKLLTPRDIEIRVPADSTARIQETHLLVLHCLCDLIDHSLTRD